MDYLWKSSGLSRGQSQRLSGVVQPTDYKYNSILILSPDPEQDIIYYYPRHSAGNWITDQKNTFLTIVALSQDIYNCDTTRGGGDNNEKCSSPELFQEYHIQLEVHGAPVYCTLITFPTTIYILSSDSCTDTKLAILHLHHNVGYFVEDNLLLMGVSDGHGQKVIDSFVAPILEITGTESIISTPAHHKATYNNISSSLLRTLLDLEVNVDFKEGSCISCGGVLLLTGSNIRYRSVPADLVPLLVQAIYWRELTRLTQGSITWFNKLFKTDLIKSTKRQSWYTLTLARPDFVVCQLIGVFGDISDVINDLISNLNLFLDKHVIELRQHLPSHGITLKDATVLGFKYGMNRIFYNEGYYENLLNEYHDTATSALSLHIEVDGKTFVGQQIIGGQLFTVCYEAQATPLDVESIFLQLGL